MSGHSHDINHLVTAWSWIVPLSVVVSSLLGSLHCVSMCGGLNLAFAPTRSSQVYYHFGRLISYVGLGAVAGYVGQHFLHHSLPPWFSWISALFFALTFLWMGIRVWNGKGLHLTLPKFLSNMNLKMWGKLHKGNLPQHLTSTLAGVLTGFLPCGWLLSFVVGAMAMQEAWKGAIFMAAFWVGTVPALAFGTYWIQSLLGPVTRKAPRLSGLVLIAIAVFTIIMRLQRHHH